jgi:hypothetical protein
MAVNTLQFKITLVDSIPVVNRTIQVPSDYNFFQFHMAIQGAFGWNDLHLFQFFEKNWIEDTLIGIPTREDDAPVQDARSIRINTVFKKAKARYSYIYDFGDGWLHEIILEKIIKEPIYTPFCIEANNACPPEDVGGIGGYQELLSAFDDNNKKEIKRYNTWIGLEKGENWDPNYCSRREINNRLSLLGYWSYEATVRFMPKGWYKPVV